MFLQMALFHSFLGLSNRVGKIPWRRKWQPIPVFLPGESHGQRSLAGYSPQGHKESGMTERLHFTSSSVSITHTHTHIFIHSSVSEHLGCFHVLAIVNMHFTKF